MEQQSIAASGKWRWLTLGRMLNRISHPVRHICPSRPQSSYKSTPARWSLKTSLNMIDCVIVAIVVIINLFPISTPADETRHTVPQRWSIMSYFQPDENHDSVTRTVQLILNEIKSSPVIATISIIVIVTVIVIIIIIVWRVCLFGHCRF